MKAVYLDACTQGNISQVKLVLEELCFLSNKDKILYNKDLSSATLQSGVLIACSKGHIDLVSFLFESPEVKATVQEHARIPGARYTSLLAHACSGGNLAMVKHLLYSKELPVRFKVDDWDDMALITACSSGRVELVSYLLTSSEIIAQGQKHANIHAQEDSAFLSACAHGHLHIMQYLATSPELKEHVAVTTQGFEALVRASSLDRVDIVRFLLKTSQPAGVELLSFAQHPHNEAIEQAFKEACEFEAVNVIRFFISELSVPLTKSIEETLQVIENQDFATQIRGMMHSQAMNQKLQDDLPELNEHTRRLKL